MNLKEKTIAFSMLTLISLAVASYGVLYGGVLETDTTITKMSDVQASNRLDYDGMVTVVLTRASTGEQIILADKKTNALMNAGKDGLLHLAFLGSGTPAYDWIALGNFTAPTNADSSLAGEISDCGFDRTQGAVTKTAVGNVTIGYMFTSTCNNLVLNTTGIFNHTTANTGYFAGTSFNNAPMYVGDTITITWSIGVEE